MSAGRPHRWRKALLNIAAAALLLLGASFLPPDTSFADRQASGVLKLCVPPSYPPLVTGDKDRPGYDIELASAIAQRIGLRLVVNVLPSIGRDFNPRNWFLTRAQCDLVGGGVADTAQTRSFLQTLPTGAETGWVVIANKDTRPKKGDTVAVLPGTSGLDRLALSSWLRSAGIKGRLASAPSDLSRLLAGGQVNAAITERFVAGSLDTSGLKVAWLSPETFPVYSLAFGLWKGDQTLMRQVRTALASVESGGELRALQDRYGVVHLSLD